MLKSCDLVNGMKHTVRSKGEEINAVGMECKQDGRTTQPESCLSAASPATDDVVLRATVNGGPQTEDG